MEVSVRRIYCSVVLEDIQVPFHGAIFEAVWALETGLFGSLGFQEC